MQATDQQLRILCNSKLSLGPATILHVSGRDATIRGLKTFVMTAMAALATIIVPGVHILSVPLGLVAAPIVGLVVFLKSLGTIKGMSGSFDCPECQAKNQLEYQEGKPPYFGSCTQCKNPYQAFPQA